MLTNFTLPKTKIDTVAASSANQITKEYYFHLVGEINRGTILKAVCRCHDYRFNYTTYHLISF
jgi:hypothetical protein